MVPPAPSVIVVVEALVVPNLMLMLPVTPLMFKVGLLAELPFVKVIDNKSPVVKV